MNKPKVIDFEKAKKDKAEAEEKARRKKSIARLLKYANSLNW